MNPRVQRRHCLYALNYTRAEKDCQGVFGDFFNFVQTAATKAFWKTKLWANCNRHFEKYARRFLPARKFSAPLTLRKIKRKHTSIFNWHGTFDVIKYAVMSKGVHSAGAGVPVGKCLCFFSFFEPIGSHFVLFCGQLIALTYFSVQKRPLLVQNTIEVKGEGVI